MALDRAAFESPDALRMPPLAAPASQYLDADPMKPTDPPDPAPFTYLDLDLSNATDATPRYLDADPMKPTDPPDPASFTYLDPAPPNATDATSPYRDGGQTIAPDAADSASSVISAASQPYAASSVELSAFSCERSPPLCAWARSSEEEAFIAVLEMPEVDR
jgi:hypothetical protein